MGLNLKINRIIFSTTHKISKGDKTRILAPHVRQIAGRAGRSNTDGFVTAFYRDDLEFIKDCLSQGTLYSDQDISEEPIKLTEEYIFKPNEQMIRQACLFPPVSTLLSIAELMSEKLGRTDDNKVTLVEILQLFEIFSNTDTLYFIKDLKKILKVAHSLQDVKAPIQLHYSFVMAPCKTKEFSMKFLRRYFKEYVEKKEVRIPDELLVDKSKYFGRHVSPDELKELQDIHNSIEIYTWLANKYKSEFIDYTTALQYKGKVTETINYILGAERRAKRMNLENE
jgi:ATP-dependent RNA helicase SUPV3L1/SUV3